MNTQKSIIESLKPSERLKSHGIVGESDKMNRRIEKNITIILDKINRNRIIQQG